MNNNSLYFISPASRLIVVSLVERSRLILLSLLNSLPDFVVLIVDTINCFKSRLDKFWINYDVLFNWEADFSGTGNQSLCWLQRFLKCCLS